MNKKRILKIFAAALLLGVFSLNSWAFDADEYYKKQLEASEADKLADELSEETKEYMAKLGCEDVELENVLKASPKAFFDFFADIVKGGYKKPLKGALEAAGAAALIGICSCFFPDDEKSKTILDVLGGCFLILVIFNPAAEGLRAAASAISACAAFEKALIPVLAAIATVAGNPALALSVRGAALAAAQATQAVSSKLAVPLIGASGALGTVGAAFPALRISSVCDAIRKTLVSVLSFSASMFAGFLTLKGAAAASADGLAARGVKLAANAFVPIVGGALGEAYSSASAALATLKNAVGIYGIVAFLAVGAPVVIDLALWTLAARLAGAASDLFDCRRCSETLKSAAFIFSTLNAVLLLCMAAFIISAGLVVLIKTGG